MARKSETKAGGGGSKKAREKAGQAALLTSTLADKKLREESPKVLDKVLEKALDGNVSCIRLLMDLSGKAGQTQACGEASDRVSLSEKWSSEPEWTGESDEVIAETTAGSREPED